EAHGIGPRSCNREKYRGGPRRRDCHEQRARPRNRRSNHVAADSTAREIIMKAHGSILLVDDEAKIRTLLTKALIEDGNEVVATESGREARRLLGQRLFDVLLVDNLMPDMTGLDLIPDLAAATIESERPQVLMMTAHATVESAIAAMKLGALDYLQKPFEIDELLVVVQRAMEHQSLRTQHRYLLAERDEEFNHYGIVGR